MVKFFLFILLTATIIAASIFESVYIEKTFEFLERELFTIEQLLEKDTENIDTEENIQAIKTLTKKWHKKATRLRFLVWHTAIKDVEVGLSKIESYTIENEYKEVFVELNYLVNFSKQYKKDFKVLLENIF